MAQVERAGELGKQLLTLLKPQRLPARKGKKDAGVEQAAWVRDAFWGEVVKRHEQLWVRGRVCSGGKWKRRCRRG